MSNEQGATSNSYNYALKSDTNSSSEKIYIALSVYDPKGTYSQHAGVVMTSIFENTQSPVCVYILHDETLTQDNRQKFLRTAEKYNQEINLIDVTEYAKQINPNIFAEIKTFITFGSLYRLFIPQIINLDKIIYLDCDVNVNLDIKELWDVNVKNYYAAAVLDKNGVDVFFKGKKSYYIWFLKCKINNCDIKDYFCAGVMLMNLNNIRNSGNLFENSMKWLKRHKHTADYGDQDILNSLFYGHMKFIDKKFDNLVTLKGVGIEPENTITHSGGEPKLWRVTGNAWQYFYWQYYLKSAWGENLSRENLVKVMLDAAYKPEQEQLKKSLLIRATQKIWHKICPSGFRRCVKMLCSEFLYRVGLKK